MICWKPPGAIFCATPRWPRWLGTVTAASAGAVNHRRCFAPQSREHRLTDFPRPASCFWYMNIILQYESNASSISLSGRFDQYMLPFYQASLNEGQDPAYLGSSPPSRCGAGCNDIVLLRLEQRALFRWFSHRLHCPLGGLTEPGAARSMRCRFYALMPIRTCNCRSRILACGSTRAD